MPPRRAENFRAALFDETGDFGRGFAARQSEGDEPADGGASDQIKVLRDRFACLGFKLTQDAGAEQAEIAAAG